ncbi:hypothetical protein BC829DRAFT_444130 [Chytridium lagenaria]|nr:hypothetical protein BC829DRAFT_444130 [Chytridium lagenaria]
MPAPFINIRRAEPHDAPVIIKTLTRDLDTGDHISRDLKRKYGDYVDINALIRPNTTLPVSNGNWEAWLKGRYETHRDHQALFVESALTAAFNLIPTLRNICYFLPDTLTLFPPFSLPRHHNINSPDNPDKKGYNPGKPHGYRRRMKHIGGDTRSKFFNEVPIKYVNAPFALYVCARRDMAPPVKVRRARVEDCDDLAPMFKKQNLLQEQNADHYLAELLESTSESIKTLVAEADGNVVGFMSLTKDIDQEVISKLFNVDVFDNLVKDPVDPIQAALDSMTPQSIALAKASAAAAANKPLSSLRAYENQAIEFVKAAFALYTDKDCHCLYIAHRFGINESVTVRRGRARDTELAADLVKSLAVEAELLRKFRDSLDESSVPSQSLLTLPNATTKSLGVAVLERCIDPSSLCDQFNVEEFVNLKVSTLTGTVLLRHLIMNPIFGHQARAFQEEVFRQAGIPCLLFAVDEQSKTDPATRLMAIQFKDGLRDGTPVAPNLPFNLQIMCPSMLYEPKKSNLYFAHLTLISSAGAPPVSHAAGLVSGLCYSPTDWDWIITCKVIKTTTNEFDRVMKRVRLHNDTTYLFVTPGVQFFHPSLSDDFAKLGGVFNLSQRDFEMVHEKLKSLGVHLFDNFKIVNWESHMHSVTSVSIWSKESKTELVLKPVDIVLYADEKSVDPETFRSINDSCLVFDGRLVIDKYFRTQDPYIYAAGSITKYSSKYQTKWAHGHYDSKEVARRHHPLPHRPMSPPPDLEENTTLLRFTSSKKISAKLPTNLNYFHFDQPRLPSHTLEYRQKRPDYVEISSLMMRKWVFQNSCGYVWVYKEFDLSGDTRDFSPRLGPPIFHDRFLDYIEESRKEILDTHSSAVDDLTFKLLDLATSPDVPIEDEERVDIYRKFTQSEDRKKWDDKIFEFVNATQVFKSFLDVVFQKKSFGRWHSWSHHCPPPQESWPSTVLYDHIAAAGDVGGGINFAVNGLRVIQELGFLDEFKKEGTPMIKTLVKKLDGRRITEFSGEAIAEKYGIHNVAQEANIPIHLNKNLTSIVQPSSSTSLGVTAHFTDGTQADGDILIGADGLNSITRSAVFGTNEPAPRFTGIEAIIGISTTPNNAVTQILQGGGKQFGMYGIGRDEVVWFVGYQQMQENLVKEKLFREWGVEESFAEVVERSSRVIRYGIFDREPRKPWSKGNVVLIGDAAHPMPPHLGQGGNTALEDSGVLSHLITRLHPSTSTTTPTDITKSARELGKINSLESPLLCSLRDAAISMTVWMNGGVPPLDAMYGYKCKEEVEKALKKEEEEKDGKVKI